MRWIDLHRMLRTPSRRVRLLFILALIGVVGEAKGQAASVDSTWVQVRLYHDTTIESVRLTPEQGPLAVVLPESGTPALRLESGTSVTLGRRQNEVYLRQRDGQLYASSLRIAPLNEAEWKLVVNAESTRTYSGSLTLSPADSLAGLQLVNRVPINEYVASVVSSEYGLNDREGTKAMAVVARTYALFTNKHDGDEYEHVDGTASQVYEGVTAVTDAARRATRQTRAEVLTYNGEPIQAVYFASSGGHTANNEDVWTESKTLPYLRGKKDPYDQSSPDHRWTSRINRRSLLQALSVHQNASVEGFLLGDRTEHGRLATIEVLRSNGSRTEIEASTFRSLVNENIEGTPLKSTWFDARREGSQYVFEGRGHGHGVGLSQWGAHAMAKQGMSYREILSFYFTGVEISQLDQVWSSPPPPQIAEVPDSTAADSTTRRVGW